MPLPILKPLQNWRARFDLILNTVSAQIDWSQYLDLLKLDGTMVVVGLPEKDIPVGAFSLTSRRRSIAGSQIGGIREIQEMLDFCSENKDRLRYRSNSDPESERGVRARPEKRRALPLRNRYGLVGLATPNVGTASQAVEVLCRDRVYVRQPSGQAQLDCLLTPRNASRGRQRGDGATRQPTDDHEHAVRKAIATRQLNRFNLRDLCS